MTNVRTGFPEGYLIYLVKQVESGLRRPLDDLISAHGISTAGYTALSVLQNRPGITSSELARRSFVRAQTMAQTVTALTEAGLVRRAKDPGHRRQLLLYASELGLERVAVLAPCVTSLEMRMIDTLADGETGDLVRMLRSCRDALVELSRMPA